MGHFDVHYLFLLGHGEEDEGKLDDVGNDLSLQSYHVEIYSIRVRARRRVSRIAFSVQETYVFWAKGDVGDSENHGGADDGDLARDQPDVGGSEGAVWGALSLNSNAWVENGCGSRGWK